VRRLAIYDASLAGFSLGFLIGAVVRFSLGFAFLAATVYGVVKGATGEMARIPYLGRRRRKGAVLVSTPGEKRFWLLRRLSKGFLVAAWIVLILVSWSRRSRSSGRDPRKHDELIFWLSYAARAPDLRQSIVGGPSIRRSWPSRRIRGIPGTFWRS